MTIGEVKAEALNLMFIDFGSTDIDADNVSSLIFNEDFSGYISRMNGSITRALNRIALKHKLGLKTAMLTGGAVIGRTIRFDLKAFEPGVLKLIRIQICSNGSAKNVYDWEMAGNYLVLPVLRTEMQYQIQYFPKAPIIKDPADTDELNIPEDAAQIIPYHIKGELYEDDDPGAAAQARNVFEAWLEELEELNENNKIDLVY